MSRLSVSKDFNEEDYMVPMDCKCCNKRGSDKKSKTAPKGSKRRCQSDDKPKSRKKAPTRRCKSSSNGTERQKKKKPTAIPSCRTVVYKFFLATLRETLEHRGRKLSEQCIKTLGKKIWSKLTVEQREVVIQEAKESRRRQRAKA